MAQGNRECKRTVSEEGRVYLDPVLSCAPRLLSGMDREPSSVTYGCGDRTYWAWKFTDFPGSRFQEGVYALASLLTLDPRGSSFRDSARVVEWCRAGCDFWRRLQHRDGSFDEAYPRERSLAATAFTTFYLGEAYLLISAELPASDGELLRETVARAAGWLTRNGERHAVISNHLGAASAALHVAHAITGERRFELGRDEYLRSVYKHQSVEGWYGEYGGADPGYQTLTIYFLASTWRSHRDSHLTNSLKSGVRFLKHFIHPDGTLGGEYGSRGTEFYFPAGFEILAREMPDAGSIAAAMRASIVRGATIGPRTVDAPNFQSILNNYVAAARYAEAIKHPAPLPCDSEGEWVFQDAGLLVKSTRRHFVVFGPAKGGILRVYAKRTRSPLFHHCGYWARLKGGAVVSTQYLQAQPVWRHASEELEGEWLFRVVPQKVFSPFVFLLFRLVSLLLVFGVGSGNWLKSLLVEALTRPGKVVPLHLRRRVFFRDESVVVSDTITADRKGGLRVATLHGGDKFSTFHTGSARYFQPGELAVPVLGKDDWAGVLMERGEVTIEIEVGDGGSPSDVGGAP